MRSRHRETRLRFAGERGQFVFRKTHALGQDDAKAVKERGLSGIGLRESAVEMCGGRQHDACD
jgi:hypothetical protein